MGSWGHGVVYHRQDEAVVVWNKAADLHSRCCVFLVSLAAVLFTSTPRFCLLKLYFESRKSYILDAMLL